MALKKRLGRSTVWMSAAASGNSAVSFLIFVVLSRILAPEEIGLVAFALIVVEAGKIVVNAGFPQAIVRHEDWDETFASTCFHLNLAFAVAITLLVYFVGVPLVSRYYEPAAGPILAVLSLIFFLEGVKAVHEGKLKREFAFHVIALRTVAGGLISGVVGIYLALRGYGVWALVGQQLVNHGLTALITLASTKWMPRLVFSAADCRRILRFSTPLMTAQLIGNVSSKVFDLLIGLLIGPAALAFFRVGGRALFILQEIVLKPFEQTVLSALSRISDRSLQASGTLRVIRMSAYLTFPVFFGAAAIGPDFIVLAFGAKWELSGHIMTVLAIGTAPLVIGYQINAALTATGNSRLVMVLATIALAINCAMGLTAVSFGLMAAAYGFAIRTYLTIFFNLYFFKKIFGVGILATLKPVSSSFLASLIVFAVINALRITPVADLHAASRLSISVATGVATYFVLMMTVFRTETRNFLLESVDFVPARFKPLIVALQRPVGS